AARREAAHQAEVHEAHAAAVLGRDEEDVPGLEIAVQDALLVRDLERARDRIEDRERVERVDLVPELLDVGEVLVERLALEQLHREVDGARDVLPEAVDAHDARPPQDLERLRLAPEAHGVLGIVGDLAAQELDGDRLAGLEIDRAVDDAVRALAELLADA